MSSNPINHPSSCRTLLHELQIIWDDTGESGEEKDKILLQIEQECIDVYRRKVEDANKLRDQLRQAIADSKAELSTMCSALGHPTLDLNSSNQNARDGCLKAELENILKQLEEMQRKKADRLNQFHGVLDEINEISVEFGSTKYISSMDVDESDISMIKLEDLHKYLETLQKEKTGRVNHVVQLLQNLNTYCSVLGMDFERIVGEVDQSLNNNHEGSKNINDSTIEKLNACIQRLRDVKLQRMQKLQDVAGALLVLWNLMDTPSEEQQLFQNITRNIAASEHEITDPHMLSENTINNVEKEVVRLEELKASKMKDLVLKKKSELDEICKRSHIIPQFKSEVVFSVEAIESGATDPFFMLEHIEIQMAKFKEESFNRKEIVEKVEKWMVACEEESWLDEYNRDENRYAAGKGAHLVLKRAEKARMIVSKLPSKVDALVAKTLTWEKEQGMKFSYDNAELLSMLEENTILREEKEQERRRQRVKKILVILPWSWIRFQFKIHITLIVCCVFRGDFCLKFMACRNKRSFRVSRLLIKV